MVDRKRVAGWWRPGLVSAAARDIDEAIYGLILATSIIAVSREYSADDAGVTAVTLVATAGVFWLAHVYAAGLAVQIRDQRPPTRAELRAIVSQQWPLVQAAILPTLILLLGVVGLIGDRTASTAALISCVVELAVAGLGAARASGASGPLVLISGVVSLAFGLLIVGLKILVH